MTDNTPLALDSFTVEYVASGIIRERSANGWLYIFNLDNGYEETVDAWADNFQSILALCPETQPCMVLHDFRRVANLEAYFQNKLKLLLRLQTNSKTYCASFVVSEDAELNTLRSLIRRQESATPRLVVPRWEIFTVRKIAMQWLLEQVKPIAEFNLSQS